MEEFENYITKIEWYLVYNNIIDLILKSLYWEKSAKFDPNTQIYAILGGLKQIN